jgi:hypothetical protein
MADLKELASRLLDLVPGTEPPLGFDRAVLRGCQPGRRRRTIVVITLAAIAACLLLITALLAIPPFSRHGAKPPAVVAVFRENGVSVGSLTAGGRPLWVSVSVRGAAVSGPVSCQLVGRGGLVQTLGLFDLVHGNGSWAAPDPAGVTRDLLARLVTERGRVVAVAILR